MGDVTGPLSTLPGSVHKLPVNATCDDHNDRPAVVRIQGETDSMGAEFIDMCQECYDEYKKHCEEHKNDTSECDVCGTDTVVFPHRDPDEGSCGPVYNVCGPCIKKQNDVLLEEIRYRNMEDRAGGDYDELEWDDATLRDMP